VGNPLARRQRGRLEIYRCEIGWLLRRRRRAAKQRDEVAPFHSITSSARASIDWQELFWPR
jgi:hypothetical protein